MKDTRDALKFTRMCKYWKGSGCNLGADCSFAHSESELRDQPDLVSTQLCFQFARKGICKNGDACTFAHGKSELRRFPKTRSFGRKRVEPKKLQEESSQADSVASLAGSRTMASPNEMFRSSMAAALTDMPLTFKPPPGLEGVESSSLVEPPPGLEPHATELRSVAEMLQECLKNSLRRPLLKQGSHDGLDIGLPLIMDTSLIPVKREVDVATESSTSTAYHSDGSEPSSPSSRPFWL